MNLLDVNVLVYAHREDTEEHAAHLEWLKRAMNAEEGIAVSELILSGFLRIVTHPKIFQPPSPLSHALSFVKEVRDHSQVTVLSPGPRHWAIFLRLCKEGEARGNLIPDAYHAALAIEYGCTWITTDRDFARFPGLKWRHPLQGCE
ncbi:MAG: type II toxin-antitoxin system VapC family toxin [Kiritimatiellia bacterium]